MRHGVHMLYESRRAIIIRAATRVAPRRDYVTKMGFTQEDMSLINIAAFEALAKRLDDDEDKSMDSLKRAQKMTLACLNRTARDTTYGGPMAATLVMGFDTHYASATSVLLTMDSFLRPAPP